MPKIYCRCCGQSAEARDQHEFTKLKKCKNGTSIQGSSNPANAQIKAIDYAKILIMNEETGEYEPLLEE